jgi:sterol desaturase/sphingolipid hydroxylase (fatty acid hydroxylase superfamily)
MNLGIIPVIMSVAIAVVCGIAALIGGALLLGEESRPLGRRILRSSGMALLSGLVFAWAVGMLACGILWNVHERAAVLSLWASGPVGVLVALVWPSGKAR